MRRVRATAHQDDRIDGVVSAWGDLPPKLAARIVRDARVHLPADGRDVIAEAVAEAIRRLESCD